MARYRRPLNLTADIKATMAACGRVAEPPKAKRQRLTPEQRMAQTANLVHRDDAPVPAGTIAELTAVAVAQRAVTPAGRGTWLDRTFDDGSDMWSRGKRDDSKRSRRKVGTPVENND